MMQQAMENAYLALVGAVAYAFGQWLRRWW